MVMQIKKLYVSDATDIWTCKRNFRYQSCNFSFQNIWVVQRVGLTTVAFAAWAVFIVTRNHNTRIANKTQTVFALSRQQSEHLTAFADYEFDLNRMIWTNNQLVWVETFNILVSLE